jgi:hypothetical protein
LVDDGDRFDAILGEVFHRFGDLIVARRVDHEGIARIGRDQLGRVGRRNDHRQLCVPEHFQCRHGGAGAVAAHDTDDARGGELAGCIDGLLSVAGIVCNDAVQLLSEHAARGIDLADGERDGVRHILAVGCLRTCRRHENADRQLVLREACPADGQRHGKARQGGFHRLQRHAANLPVSLNLSIGPVA